MPNHIAEEVPVSPKPKSMIAPLLFIFLIILLGGGYFYLSQTYPALFQQTAQRIRDTVMSQSPTPTPSPQNTSLSTSTPPKPFVTLPTGSQTYNFSHGDQVLGPKTSTVTIDPLTPSAGQTQTITLKATHTSPITSVSVEVITDNQITPQTLTQKDGTNQDGTWSGSWQISDGFESRYGLRLILKSADHNYDNIMWFRN